MAKSSHPGSGVSERYGRQQMVQWLSRDRLQSLRVAVIGAGAVGNEVIKNLALLGVGHVDVFDFDRIEIHNLTRSVLFRESDVGRGKAVVAVGHARQINPDVAFNAVEGDLWDQLNVKKTSCYDVVFGCVDNFEARMRASYLCRLACVDFISAGIDSRYVSVQWHRFSRLQSSDGSENAIACYECDMGQAAYEAVDKRYSCGWLRKIADESKLIPTTAITASIAAAHAVSQFLNAGEVNATDSANDCAGRLLVDTLGGQSSKTALPLNDQCLACAGLSVSTKSGKFNGSLDSLRHQHQIPIEFDAERQHIVFSEALILACRCVNDEDHAKTLDKSVRLQPARNYSEAIGWCSICGDSSIDIDIAESLSISDWQRRFDGARLGCQFIRMDAGDGSTHIYDNDADQEPAKA